MPCTMMSGGGRMLKPSSLKGGLGMRLEVTEVVVWLTHLLGLDLVPALASNLQVAEVSHSSVHSSKHMLGRLSKAQLNTYKSNQVSPISLAVC